MFFVKEDVWSLFPFFRGTRIPRKVAHIGFEICKNLLKVYQALIMSLYEDIY